MADAVAKGKRPRSTANPESHTDDDAFVRSTVKSWGWIQKNLRMVLLGASVLVLLVAGTVYYVNFQASVGERAAADLARLRSMAATPDDVIPDLEAYVARFDGTSSADEARITLARLYMDSGRPAEAIVVLEAVDDAPDRPSGFAARSLLAAAQEANGDTDLALSTWEGLVDDARFAFQRRAASASVARLYVAAGRTEEAAAIYSTIAEEAEEADDLAAAGVYRIRLGEIEPQGDTSSN